VSCNWFLLSCSAVALCLVCPAKIKITTPTNFYRQETTAKKIEMTESLFYHSGTAHNAVAPGNLALPERPHPSVATTAYRDLTGTKVPTWPLAAMYLPFRDLARDLIVPQHGVILIENVFIP